MNIQPINPLVWVGLFIGYFIFEILYTKYILSIAKLKALRATILSVLIYLITALGTINYIENILNIIPIIVASGLGTYFMLKYEIRRKRNKHK